MSQMRVVIESPLAGNIEKNMHYARMAMLHCLRLGEAPYASHLLFCHEDLLDDNKPHERTAGMDAGFSWAVAGAIRAVYVDLGLSDGMVMGIRQAIAREQHVQFRKLPDDLMARHNEWSEDHACA